MREHLQRQNKDAISVRTILDSVLEETERWEVRNHFPDVRHPADTVTVHVPFLFHESTIDKVILYPTPPW